MATAIDDNAEIGKSDVRSFKKSTCWYTGIENIDDIINIIEKGFYNYEHK